MTNPFYNPATSLFDFSYYIANNPTYSDLDVVTIFLGRNDGYTNGFENGLDTIVASVRAYSATIKIVLLTPYPTGITNDGTGRVLQNTWDERRDMFIGLNAFYNKFKNSEASNIYIVPVYLNLDTMYDYPHTLEQVSARNTETVMRITDNVHPNNFGGMKFADVWYNWFVWYLQQV